MRPFSGNLTVEVSASKAAWLHPRFHCWFPNLSWACLRDHVCLSPKPVQNPLCWYRWLSSTPQESFLMLFSLLVLIQDNCPPKFTSLLDCAAYRDEVWPQVQWEVTLLVHCPWHEENIPTEVCYLWISRINLGLKKSNLINQRDQPCLHIT